MTKPFSIDSQFTPTGDQPQAIRLLCEGIRANKKHQILHGVTGSGKTFTMANIIAELQRPALILAPNKTLAAQLYNEFKSLFPKNAVEYFVSYYDYYQPEAYVPATDTYIEKDSAINDAIDRMRHSATRSLLTRRDVIIVASVSCIYGLGSPDAYLDLNLNLNKGLKIRREVLIRRLIEIQYKRNDMDFSRGTFRVRGDHIDVYPAYEDQTAVRIELFGDEVDALYALDPLRGVTLEKHEHMMIFPASHYVTTQENKKRAVKTILVELKERVAQLDQLGKIVESQRLKQRTLYDLELIEELGFCNGIENYSRHLTGRAPGEPPPTLIDFFPKDALMFIDESHVSVPQIGGMFRGDRARKMTLVEHGFRLPSALDNRPLTFEEFERHIVSATHVSATPGPYELEKTGGEVVEQVIRPTGLLDPIIEVLPAQHQLDHLIGEARKHIANANRVLVTTLTKKMAEDITDYMNSIGLRVRYLHSEIDALERTEILHDLRKGIFDILVGINLLREGLDLPEVSLVAILDADKEGFLRSTRSLIQTIGRAARNIEGRVLMYANTMTDSMKTAIEETKRRRAIQEAHNKKHGITPKSISRMIHEPLRSDDDEVVLIPLKNSGTDARIDIEDVQHMNARQQTELIESLTRKMKDAATALDFEKAAELRDTLRKVRNLQLGVVK